MAIRVVHISTTHARDEVRIFLKECLSLSKAGYEVHFLVNDGKGDNISRGVFFHDIGATENRCKRIFLSPWKMLAKARSLKANLYHLHDPELLLIALSLAKEGSKVVYDSHEDFPRAMLSREWMWKPVMQMLSLVIEAVENFVVKRITAVIGATPHITTKFSKMNKMLENINNYPLLAEMNLDETSKSKTRSLCYQGNISHGRGVLEIVKAMDYVDASLNLVGSFTDDTLRNTVKKMADAKKVNIKEWAKREYVHQIMGKSVAGLLTFHPEPNHINAQPNKMFEYMSAGLPVIASYFPLWKEIIEGNRCGICVNPLDPKAIAKAITYIIEHHEEAEQMGKNGRQAVLKKYNWDVEEKKLLAFYERICG